VSQAKQRSLRTLLEANGVEPWTIQRLRQKGKALPEGYKAPLEVAGQVWAVRLQQRQAERAERQRRKQQSEQQLAQNVAAAAALQASTAETESKSAASVQL
jgi:hypothetical protein